MNLSPDKIPEFPAFYSVVELLAEIEKRPMMWTPKPYISCLKSFLDGWHLGRDGDISDAEVMDDFQDWIIKKYSVTSSHGWADIILFYSNGEAEALKNFFSLFNEWRSSTKK